MLRKIPHPSPALVVASLALLVALSGSAVAAGVIPHALLADNAKKLQGKTSSQLVALASASARTADDAAHLQGKSVEEVVALAQTKSVAGFFTLKQANFSMPPSSARDYTISCDGGQKAISGGSEYSQAPAIMAESRPSADGTAWKIQLVDPSSSDGAFGNLYAICVG